VADATDTGGRGRGLRCRYRSVLDLAGPTRVASARDAGGHRGTSGPSRGTDRFPAADGLLRRVSGGSLPALPRFLEASPVTGTGAVPFHRVDSGGRQDRKSTRLNSSH